jgi:hypothetical protein
MDRIYGGLPVKRYHVVEKWEPGAVKVYDGERTYWAVEDDGLPSLDDIPTLGEDENEPA